MKFVNNENDIDSYITSRHKAPPKIIKTTSDLHYGDNVYTEDYKREYANSSLYFTGIPQRLYKNYNVDDRGDFVGTTKSCLTDDAEDFVESRKPIFIQGLPTPESIKYIDLDFPQVTRKTGSYWKK